MRIDLSHIKEGEYGDYKIQKFVVTKRDVALQAGSMFRTGRYCPEGEYFKLMRGSTLVMSNTPDEIRDHLDFIRRAEGSILINGLGIGMCLTAVLSKESITDVTVVEISKEVLALVGPYFNDDRITFVNESAFDYKPPKGKKFDFVWHDIWDDICLDNLEEMKRLHRKYGRKSDWQGSWSRPILEREKRKERNYYSYW